MGSGIAGRMQQSGTAPHPPPSAPPTDGPLAEFAALRAEILQNSQQMAGLFALQVGASGTALSYSLATPQKQFVALVVSYLLCSRYFYHYHSIRAVARYIHEELSPRIPGGLGWEEWLQRNVRWSGRPVRQQLGNAVAFTGTAILAWLLSTPGVFAAHASADMRAVLVISWATSLGFVGLTGRVIVTVLRIRP